MLDSSTPPSADQVRAAVADGQQRGDELVAWGGYGSAPGHPEGWSPAQWEVIRGAGRQPVYIWCGDDGRAAAAAATADGFRRGEPVAIDVERGAATVQGAATFPGLVRAAGFSPWLYGVDSVCDTFGRLYDVVWRARWASPRPTAGAGEVIQWSPTHTEFECSVDRSTLSPEVLAMTTQDRFDVAGGLVEAVYAGVMHRIPEDTARAFWVAHLAAVGMTQGLRDLVEHQGEPIADLAADYARDHAPK